MESGARAIVAIGLAVLHHALDGAAKALRQRLLERRVLRQELANLGQLVARRLARFERRQRRGVAREGGAIGGDAIALLEGPRRIDARILFRGPPGPSPE